MTGFCKLDVHHQNLACSIEIRSVNNRFLDARVHLPKPFQHLEETLKKRIKGSVQRGKVDVYLQLDKAEENSERLKLNWDVWQNVKSILDAIEQDLGASVAVGLSDLLSIRNLITYEEEAAESDDDYLALFEKAMQQGIEQLLQMRGREGELLLKDMRNHLQQMHALLERIAEYRQEALDNQQQRLRKSIEALGVNYQADDPRITQEIGIYMDRSDISEELQRFNSHLVQLNELFDSPEAVGRKLDFILQELNREANTLCSKSNHTAITQIGVNLKSEIEKLREQVQNIE